MAALLGTVKQGDTFAFYLDLNDDETPVTGAAAKLKSQVRAKSNGNLIAELTITEEVSTPGRYLFKSTDTQTWPIGIQEVDIQYEDGDIVTSSETLDIKVVKDVTR